MEPFESRLLCNFALRGGRGFSLLKIARGGWKFSRGSWKNRISVAVLAVEENKGERRWTDVLFFFFVSLMRVVITDSLVGAARGLPVLWAMPWAKCDLPSRHIHGVSFHLQGQGGAEGCQRRGDNDNDTLREVPHLSMRALPYRQERRGHGPTKKNLSYM